MYQWRCFNSKWRVRVRIQVLLGSIRSLIQELVATPQTASFCERGNRVYVHTRARTPDGRSMRGKVAEERTERKSTEASATLGHGLSYTLMRVTPSVTGQILSRWSPRGSRDRIVRRCRSSRCDSQNNRDTNSVRRCPNRFAATLTLEIKLHRIRLQHFDCTILT